MAVTARNIFQKPHIWAFTTYFAEGFPYTVIRTVSSVFFRDMKISLEAIGLTSLFGLPWVLKFLWGPQIDQFSTKRHWILSMQFLLFLVLCAVAFIAPLSGGSAIIAGLFFAGAFLAATHDIAIDGYYMEALDKKGQSRFVGFRVMAYRISMMTGTGITVTIGTTISWRVGFLFAAVLLGILFTYHFFLLPRIETPQRPMGMLLNRDAFYSRAFMTYIHRKGIGVAISFIILMRTGEAMLASMVSPFMVDLGIEIHYGWISGCIGLPFSIAGAMLGGWLISRYSLKKTILPFLLAQNLTNVVYMFLALGLDQYLVFNTGADHVTPIGIFNLLLVACVHAFDQFAGGLGTAVLVTFLMRTCLSEFKAAHFAIGTGLMNISGVLSGVMGGILAQRLGYGYFFGISFLVSIPGMAIVFFLPFPDSEQTAQIVDDV